MENPEAANYYDWYISDPKESPYATFRFYYRSLAILQETNIIPNELSYAALDPPRSTKRNNIGFKIEHADSLLEHFKFYGESRHLSFDRDSSSGVKKEEQCIKQDKQEARAVRSASNAFKKKPSFTPPTNTSIDTRNMRLPQPSKINRDYGPLRNRILPKLPEFHDHRDLPPCRSRASSLSSAGNVSVANSLHDYVNTPFSDSESVEVGIATQLTLSECVAASLALQTATQLCSFKQKPLAKIEKCTTSSNSQGSLSPEPTYARRKGEEMCRDTTFLEHVSVVEPRVLKKQRSFSEIRTLPLGNLIKASGEFLGLAMTKVKLSEPEWIRRSSSPSKLKEKCINIPSDSPGSKKEGKRFADKMRHKSRRTGNKRQEWESENGDTNFNAEKFKENNPEICFINGANSCNSIGRRLGMMGAISSAQQVSQRTVSPTESDDWSIF